MKKINYISDNCIEVEYEPGDMTRYSFFVHRLSPDDYSIAPKDSTFRFPQRLNIWDVTDIDEENLMRIAEKENCNPYTLKAVIDIIMIISQGRD